MKKILIIVIILFAFCFCSVEIMAYTNEESFSISDEYEIDSEGRKFKVLMIKMSDRHDEEVDAYFDFTTNEVFTPNGNDVSADEYILNDETNTLIVETELPQFIIDDLSQINMGRYSGIIELFPATTRFNCHSYAWYSQDYENNTIWIEDPKYYYWENDQSYEEVEIPRVGDIICYINDMNTSSFSDDLVVHSGIISQTYGWLYNNDQIDNLYMCKVTSKWGLEGLYIHDPLECPYVPNYGGTADYVKYYRPRTHASYTISDYKSLVKDIFFTSEEYDNTNNYEMYELSSEYTKSYTFTISSSILFDVKLFSQNMNEIEGIVDLNSSNYISSFNITLNANEIYYLKVISTNNDTGTISAKIESNSNKVLTIGSNSIYTNKYANTANYIFNNTYGTGLYKVSLSSNISSHVGLLTIYDNEYKTNPMNRLTTSSYELDAITSANSNNLVVYLEFGETYYIDVSVPNNNITSLMLNIELIDDEYTIDVSEDGSLEAMDNETQLGDNFVKIDIVYQSVFYIDYDYNGTQEETIYFVLYKEVYNIETQKYELQLVLPELLVTNGESFTWSSVLSSGTYYIGYYNKLNSLSTISISIGG